MLSSPAVAPPAACESPFEDWSSTRTLHIPATSSCTKPAGRRKYRWGCAAAGITVFASCVIQESLLTHRQDSLRRGAPCFAVPSKSRITSVGLTPGKSCQATSGSSRREKTKTPLLAAAMNFVVATGASIAVLAAAGVTSFLRQRRRVPSTMLKAKKKRTSIGPKKLKSGYWQEDDDDDDDIDIFEWISAEDLEDEPPVTLSAEREIAAYSQLEDFPTERYAAPEYRPPKRPLQLQKGIKKPPPPPYSESYY
mmetsp:Transcript_3401/g.3992  ORF Transcript_3401/g.3992 Transcript_3401/m.3992 type:complete len:252 (+) Transcript_3401:104-859(+)